jgi:hypothetical protein
MGGFNTIEEEDLLRLIQDLLRRLRELEAEVLRLRKQLE